MFREFWRLGGFFLKVFPKLASTQIVGPYSAIRYMIFERNLRILFQK
jgi:hypothetical protein